MPIDIYCWNQDSTPIDGIWVVSECDKDDFEVVKELFNKYTVYLVNDKVSCRNISNLYLHLLYNDNIDGVTSVDILGSREWAICNAILSAINNLRNFDIKMAETFIKFLYVENNDCRLDKIIFFLEKQTEIVSKHKSEVITGSIYGNVTRKTWWLERPFSVSFIGDISSLAIKFPDRIKCNLDAKIFMFSKMISVSASRNVENILIMLSAACYSCAPYYIANNYHMVAYLLVHRSLDLYMASKAYALDLIKIKSGCLTYHNVMASEDESIPRIHLYSTYFHYLKLTDRLDPCHEDTIRRINKKRNELLPTHGVDAVSRDEIDDAYINAGHLMKSDANWKDTLDCFKTKIIADPKEMIYEAFNITDMLTEYK